MNRELPWVWITFALLVSLIGGIMWHDLSEAFAWIFNLQTDGVRY